MESNLEPTFIQELKTFGQFTSETLQLLQNYVEDGRKLSKDIGRLIDDDDPKVITNATITRNLRYHYFINAYNQLNLL